MTEERPYESHLPILKALAETLDLKRVIEFGAGDHSTPFFLDLDLDRFVSIESDPEWVNPRAETRSEWTEALDFDLVLIDDGLNAAERMATIDSVLGQEDHPLTVIHDAEVYADRIVRAGYHFVFRFDIPHTALCWPRKPDLDLVALAHRVAELT